MSFAAWLLRKEIPEKTAHRKRGTKQRERERERERVED
jgi:hypothetical protein